MAEAKISAFEFRNFRIPAFSYIAPSNPDSVIGLDFQPRGKYNKDKGIFELSLILTGFINEHRDNIVLTVTCFAYFKFEKGLDISKIPQFFYGNSIAIVYPYIRAFVSTMTLQSNSGLLMLSVMNLSTLEKTLRENTIAEESAAG